MKTVAEELVPIFRYAGKAVYQAFTALRVGDELRLTQEVTQAYTGDLHNRCLNVQVLEGDTWKTIGFISHRSWVLALMDAGMKVMARVQSVNASYCEILLEVEVADKEEKAEEDSCTAYTVGVTAYCEAALTMPGTPPPKRERGDRWVWRSAEEAERFRISYLRIAYPGWNYVNFSTYRIKLPNGWTKDVGELPEYDPDYLPHLHYLRIDAEIVERVIPTQE
jgi:hypothetical protein